MISPCNIALWSKHFASSVARRPESTYGAGDSAGAFIHSSTCTIGLTRTTNRVVPDNSHQAYDVMLLRKMKVGLRSAAAFSLIGLTVGLLGAISVIQMRDMASHSALVDKKWLPSILLLQDMQHTISELRIEMLRSFLTKDNDTHVEKNTERQLVSLREKISHAKDNYGKNLETDEERAAFDRLTSALGLYIRAQEKVMDLSINDSPEQAINLTSSQLNAHGDALAKVMTDLRAINIKEAEQAAKNSEYTFELSILWVGSAIILAMVLTTVLAILFTRSIVAPLRTAVKVAEEIAKGNLTTSIESEGGDEPAQLLQALSLMQTDLRQTIHLITDSSNQLASAAEELYAVTEESTRALQLALNAAAIEAARAGEGGRGFTVVAD